MSCYSQFITTLACRIKSKLPEPTGTTVPHFALISFAIVRFIPLSTLRLRLAWRGCWHFFEGLNLTSSSARCLGHIVKSRPSESPNKPTRARMSCFSDTTLVWDTFRSLRCSFMLSVHEFRGISCCRPGHREETSHWLPQYVAKEQGSWAISTRTTRSNGCSKRFLEARAVTFNVWRYFDVAVRLNHENWTQWTVFAKFNDAFESCVISACFSDVYFMSVSGPVWKGLQMYNLYSLNTWDFLHAEDFLQNKGQQFVWSESIIYTTGRYPQRYYFRLSSHACNWIIGLIMLANEK